MNNKLKPCHWYVAWTRDAGSSLYITKTASGCVVEAIQFSHEGSDGLLWVLEGVRVPELVATRKDGRVHIAPDRPGKYFGLSEKGLEIPKTSKMLRAGQGLVVTSPGQLCRSRIGLYEGKLVPMFYTEDPK